MKKTILSTFALFIFSVVGNVWADGPQRVRGNGGQAYGCVTGATMITLSSGKQMRIDLLDASHSVLNSLKEEANILYTLAGPEKLPMYRIKTVSGKMIEATDGHPFYSKEGVLAAKKFTNSEEILTVDGFEKIESIEKFLYSGLVYNMALINVNYDKNQNIERIDPFLGLTSQEHTVILNDFISGDILIQRLISK